MFIYLIVNANMIVMQMIKIWKFIWSVFILEDLWRATGVKVAFKGQ